MPSILSITKRRPLVYFLILGIVVASCNNSGEQDRNFIVPNVKRSDEKTIKSIKEVIENLISNKGKIADSIPLKYPQGVISFYKSTQYSTVWSTNQQWHPLVDSMIHFIKNAQYYGLFPQDYHAAFLQSFKPKLDLDTLHRLDPIEWVKADIMLTDAFLHLAKDLKMGRLDNDSSALIKMSATDNFYTSYLLKILSTKQFITSINALQPQYPAYRELIAAVPLFVDSMDRRQYTQVHSPLKANDAKDSISSIRSFQQRLYESDCLDSLSNFLDSIQLAKAIKRFQLKNFMKPDGIISQALVKKMNENDAERFIRIAINLDRFKQLPDSIPEKYVWVNLPGYYLHVYDHDTVALYSKIICGKPNTRTPLLNSAISNMVIFPTWTVPNSIITKQYLPKLKTNAAYLSRLGLKLVNANGQTISAHEVNWNKYSKGIPYKVVQRSGDDNALGVMKFNFSNPFDVYLHDTNQRYLFSNAFRALSHGCVRVEKWKELAFFFARNDSLHLKAGDSLRYNTDSLNKWLGKKANRKINLSNKVPLFISYITCEAKEGKIKFHNDMYGEDILMKKKYFSNK